MSTLKKAATRTITLPIHVLRYTASEPVFTGALLYLLTKAPAHIRDRVLKPFRSNLLANNADARLNTLIRTLKYLLAIGIVTRVNRALNRLALNYWYLRRPGAPWRFGDPQKSELVVITGGCSGFGYEMVKGFSGKARVIVLDILPMPEELAHREHLFLAQ